MQKSHDLVFLKHFSMVIVFLMVVTVALIGGAALLHYGRAADQDEFAEQRLAQRLQPVGAVYAGETGAAALAAAQEAAREAAKGQVAFEGTLDGAVIYNGLCAACHGSGAGGAPKLETAAWTARIAQGVDVLVKHAIEGYQGPSGLMPARGGNPALTDEQVDSTVKWMLDNIK